MSGEETKEALPPLEPAVLLEAKEFLRGVPGNGASVYDHLTQVLVRLLAERPPDANALFEEVSAAVREATIAEAARVPTDAQLAEKLNFGSEKARAAVLNYTRPRTPLFNAPAAEYNPAQVSFPDLLDESRLWKWAGVSFGDATTYTLHVSLKALAVEKQLQGMRFWGKVCGRQGDYFLAEALTPRSANPAASRSERLVLEGVEGANKLTYFASASPGAPDTWAQLPPVTAGQLAVAQQVRRFFTGQLDAPVPCFPPLPPSPGAGRAATEANLLRAVVGLITADTKLALPGHLDTDTEEGLDGQGDYTIIKPAEAPDDVAFDSLKDPSTLVHAELDVNAAGRTQPTPQPLGPDGEPLEPEGEPDPEPRPPLRSLADDTRPCSEHEAAILAEAGGLETKALWQLKGADAASLPAAPSGPPVEEGSAAGKAESAQSVVVAKSLKWPGAVAVAQDGKTCVNVYVGLGVASNGFKPQPFALPLPQPVQAEWRDPAVDPEDDAADKLRGKLEDKDVIFEPQAEAEEE